MISDIISVLREIHFKIKYTISEYYYRTKLPTKNADTLWLSIGENCLTDSILQRTKRKCFSTIYSYGRSNIDYVLDMESNGCADLLSDDFLYYTKIANNSVVRSSKYNRCEPIFHDLHVNGFEFTHHDPIKNIDHRNSINRKIHRIKNIKNSNIIFLYHHRKNKNSDVNKLICKSHKLVEHFRRNNNKCLIVLFYQCQCENKKRHLEMQDHRNVLEFKFYTNNIWEGDNQAVFWGKNDNDLIFKMIVDIELKSEKIFTNDF